MRALKKIKLSFNQQEKFLFSINARETARGFRAFFTEFETTGKTFKNIIKINDKIYETEVENIRRTSIDVVFPALKKGTYLGELQVLDENSLLKTGIYKIEVLESLTSEEIEKIPYEIKSSDILWRMEEAEKAYKEKIEELNETLEEGITAYDSWLRRGNVGTEEDFVESLYAREKQYSFFIDENGNLYCEKY